ncbi:MAG: site-specific integrase [Colwellia sp.]|nr:site-specific integrase [Colwellia sp.]
MSLLKKNRIVLIRHVKHSYSEISSCSLNKNSQEVQTIGGSYYITPSHFFNEKHDIYLFPFIFNKDRSPWKEANLFLFSSAQDVNKGYSNSNAVREKASLLLDYKIFCEKYDIDLYDFKGRKPRRPTYKYFFELIQNVNDGIVSRKKLNKQTKVVYDFYKYLSLQHNSLIDIDRVDSVESVNRFYQSSHGKGYSVTQSKRGQSLAVSASANPTRIGFIREDGEELRPLLKAELDELLTALSSEKFAIDERLIHYIALQTGARKQSILTLRMKHLKLFSKEHLLKDKTFRVNAGPGTGIDTKYDKPQVLYFPEELAKQIKIYAFSQKAKNRRIKFVNKNDNILNDDEMYLFLSSAGGEHYMAKKDPRYFITKSRPQGRNTYSMNKKLSKLVSEKFPSDFVFHWLRATYALRYYLYLKPLFSKGIITDGNIISMVQKRLHHVSREATERYLKLFDSIDERLIAQQLYEERVFDLYGSCKDSL